MTLMYRQKESTRPFAKEGIPVVLKFISHGDSHNEAPLHTCRTTRNKKQAMPGAGEDVERQRVSVNLNTSESGGAAGAEPERRPRPPTQQVHLETRPHAPEN